MERLACVNVAALPLQLLLHAHPAWASQPVAVVEHDRPQALVLFLNARAHRAGVRTGQRYATALSIAKDLHAAAVTPSQIGERIHALTGRLRRFTPDVEPSPDMPGIFWLDAGGLERLFPSLSAWAGAIRDDLQQAGMDADVAVGTSRFGTYALAKSHKGVMVCAHAAAERAAVQQVPLGTLDLDPGVRDRLLMLGITTVGEFLRLPANGIRARFGDVTDRWYQLAAGRRWTPLVPAAPEEVHQQEIHFDTPDSDVDRLLFVIKRVLDVLLAGIASRGHAVAGLTLWMKLDNRATRTEQVRPAATTLDVTQLLTLVRLRLDAITLPTGIVTLGLTAETSPATSDQIQLFARHGRRDPDAARRAFAQLRAEFGEQSVVRARLCDAHLPGSRFIWEPIDSVPSKTEARVVSTRPVVRRIFAAPVLAGAKAPAYVPETGNSTLSGPYVLSGAWWAGGVHRDYYFVHGSDGSLLWLYYDQRQQRFLQQGLVE